MKIQSLTIRTLSGVYAAVPTPLQPDGSPDLKRLHSILDFLLSKGMSGFCIGGATGEYAACGCEERVSLFRSVARHLKGRAALIFGVGAEHSGQVRRLAQAAKDCGGIAVLLPPPAFFRFDPADRADFIRQVGAELPLPALIYNIPQFAGEVEMNKVLHMAHSTRNIIGLKDSSGLAENLAAIQKAKASQPMTFMIGSDELLFAALDHGADGVISGTASVCPELILAIYEAFRSGKREQAQMLQARLDEFLSRITRFPPPWAMKLALKARGVDAGGLGWPLSKSLQSEAEELQNWVRGWLVECETAGLKSGIQPPLIR